MNDKNFKIGKNDNLTKKNNRNIEKKFNYLMENITKTSVFIQRHKMYDVIGSKELNLCLKQLEKLMEKTLKLSKIVPNKKNRDEVEKKINEINEELILLIKSFGTFSVKLIVELLWGEKYVKSLDNEKMKLIEKFVYPINYKMMNWKIKEKKNKKLPIAKNRIVEDFMITDRAESLDCYDLSRTSSNFQTKVYGIKIAFQNEEKKKTLIICGMVESVIIQCMNNNFVNSRYKKIYISRPKEPDFNKQEFDNFLNILTLKDYLIYNNDEIYNKYIGYINQLELIKKKTISQVVKEYLSSSLYQQRSTIIRLLINNNNSEYQYLAYLLYDLLSNDSNGSIDSYEQTLLFDSLPWYAKKYFSIAMDKTMNYTKTLSQFDTSKIPLEQQICLLKAPDNVKEKAMVKLKEVKAKSEDSGSKARQYLEGLIKIPFGIYKNEHILQIMKNINNEFNKLMETINENNEKDNYNILQIKNSIKNIENNYIKKLRKKNKKKIIDYFTSGKRDILVSHICYLNSIIKKSKNKIGKLCHSGKKNIEMKKIMRDFLDKNLYKDFCKEIHKKVITDNENIIVEKINIIKKYSENMEQKIIKIKNNLNDSVHGHKNAKRQIERIIGQWISGKQKGYCFGFEELYL